MCGIVGYIGARSATPIILDGLQRLEYRGYDSAGLAVIDTHGRVNVRRDVGKLANLANLVAENPAEGSVGIGHTRWATHGKPTTMNAHPHVSTQGDVVVIHNGIVENFVELRRELVAQGCRFRSETDTEVIPHLVEKGLEQGLDLFEASRQALLRLRGAHGIVILSRRQPDQLITARLGNAGGISVGEGQDEMFVASDVPALLPYTRRVIYLEDREMAVVTRSGASYFSVDSGQSLEKRASVVAWDAEAAAKGQYQHFMQKEIYDQGRTLVDTIGSRVDFETGVVTLPELNLSTERAQALNRVIIVACGTSAYAGLVGKFLIESLAGIPTEVDYGSEFRYRDLLVDERSLVVAITQSGETADTLASMSAAKAKGAFLSAIVNVVGSAAARSADGIIPMNAGPEIGVASTKAFTASIVDLYLLALALGQARGKLNQERSIELVRDLAALPGLVGQILDPRHEQVFIDLAENLYGYTDFLYLGRGINYPIALEGALKLKEISYIHAEGYPAGEMKHGPIALIDENMPVVVIAVKDAVYEKMISQIEQVHARNGRVIAVATAGDDYITQKADRILWVPPVSPWLSPVLTVLPLQLLAYHIAVRRGCDVDQPRNLAKSVTVE